MSENRPPRARHDSSASHGVITEAELRRRTDSVSQATLIVQANADKTRRRAITSTLVLLLVLLVGAFLWRATR